MDHARLSYLESGNSFAHARPLLCLIPGGPGLSSSSLGPVAPYLAEFDVALLDPSLEIDPLLESEAFTFQSTVEALKVELSSINRPLVVCGHSFGGYYAAGLCLEKSLEIVGFVGIGAMLSPKAVQTTLNAFQAASTPDIGAAQGVFFKSPTDENYRRFLSALTPIYFVPSKREGGKKLLEADLLSAKAFIQLYPYNFSAEQSSLLTQLRPLVIPKLLIAGTEDILCPSSQVEEDAVELGAEAIFIPEAAHFVTYEQPEKVCSALKRYFGG